SCHSGGQRTTHWTVRSTPCRSSRCTFHDPGDSKHQRVQPRSRSCDGKLASLKTVENPCTVSAHSCPPSSPRRSPSFLPSSSAWAWVSGNGADHRSHVWFWRILGHSLMVASRPTAGHWRPFTCRKKTNSRSVYGMQKVDEKNTIFLRASGHA